MSCLMVLIWLSPPKEKDTLVSNPWVIKSSSAPSIKEAILHSFYFFSVGIREDPSARL